MKTLNIIILLAVASSLTGCASTMLSTDKIAINTASVIGVPQEDITITDRRTDGDITYYKVRTKKGTVYNCTVSGGGVLDLGMTQVPNCNKK